MMTRLGIMVSLALFAAPVSAFAQTPWSALGVIADGRADNAAALNALPANTAITGDCPAGGNIRIAGPWRLKSNLTIRMQHGCTVSCDWAGNPGAGCITQADLRAPLTNVSIDGLTLVNTNPSFLGKAMRFWIDHLSMTNLTTRGFLAFAYVRGSDQEWKFDVTSPARADASIGVATAGFRHFGNSPKVPTRPGRPANVWVHDSVIYSGDAALQVAPACQPNTIWRNLDADNYLYEHTRAFGTPGNMILIGNGAQDIGLECSNRISDISIRGISGSTGTSAIRIQNAFNQTGSISNVQISDLVADLTSKEKLEDQAAIMVRGYDGSPIEHIALQRISIKHTYARCVDISAYPTSDLTLNAITCDAPRIGTLSNAVIRAASGTKLSNSTIAGAAGGALEIGPAANNANPLLRRVNGGRFSVAAPVITDNTFANGAGGRSAIVLGNAERAIVRGNTIVFAPAASQSTGISLQQTNGSNLGVRNSTVTDNDLSTAASQSAITCAVGQGNTVSGNKGASDCGP